MGGVVRVKLGLLEVDVVPPDNRVFWCSDWAMLVHLAHSGTEPRITHKHCGPDTYGHVEYYVKEEPCND
jgi:hypothetical protein